MKTGDRVYETNLLLNNDFMFRFYKRKGWNNEITSFDVTIVSEGDLIARGGYWDGDQWKETENFGPGNNFRAGIYHVKLDMNTMIILLAFVGYGVVGFIDDYIIVVQKNNEGLKPAHKFLLQSILAVVFFFLYRTSSTTDIWIPIFNVTIDLSWFYFILVFFMFTAETNAVNLTDGLDGLCAGQMVIALVPFVVFALMQGLYNVACLICLVIFALLGYLKFNKHPAQIFMGDTGSLALGGLIAAVAMVLKQEIFIDYYWFCFCCRSLQRYYTGYVL